uniref:Putative secreted protein n=1 Tax=Anopheles marajoara TaxID=58244 RepID=A0A2M4C7G1_9DIPT
MCVCVCVFRAKVLLKIRSTFCLHLFFCLTPTGEGARQLSNPRVRRRACAGSSTCLQCTCVRACVLEWCFFSIFFFESSFFIVFPRLPPGERKLWPACAVLTPWRYTNKRRITLGLKR